MKSNIESAENSVSGTHALAENWRDFADESKDTKVQVHAGRRERLRKRFLEHGIQSFTESEVAEFMLGFALPRIDTHPLAYRLLRHFGSLIATLDAHPDKLVEVEGMGPGAAAFVNFLQQFTTYLYDAKKIGRTIKSPQDAHNFLQPIMNTYSLEHFVVVAMDLRGKIILKETFTGTLDRVNLDIRRIVDAVLRVKTKFVIFAHNHLESEPWPSRADMDLTRLLVGVFEPLEISVMDHIIFGKNKSSFSFSKKGYIDEFVHEHRLFRQG